MHYFVTASTNHDLCRGGYSLEGLSFKISLVEFKCHVLPVQFFFDTSYSQPQGCFSYGKVLCIMI